MPRIVNIVSLAPLQPCPGALARRTFASVMSQIPSRYAQTCFHHSSCFFRLLIRARAAGGSDREGELAVGGTLLNDCGRLRPCAAGAGKEDGNGSRLCQARLFIKGNRGPGISIYGRRMAFSASFSDVNSFFGLGFVWIRLRTAHPFQRRLLGFKGKRVADFRP